MGGGRGVNWPTGKSWDELLRENVDKEEMENFKQDVNLHVKSLLADLNNRDTEQIRKHLETLQTALEKDIEGHLDLAFGGSVSKHTYANGLSDVDMLVRLNGSSLKGMSPKEVLIYFAQRLSGRLPNTEVKVGALAVTVKFKSGHEIQLLPCVSTETGVRIAKADGSGWSNVIKPDVFAKKLSDVNKEKGGKVVPIIKLFKSANDRLPEGLRLSGYHIESLAIEAFKGYNGSKTYHSMLHHFCNFAQDAVLRPIRDSTGQSIHVDEYLDASGSILRRQVSKGLERLSNKMKRADVQLSLNQWKDILGE